MSVLQRLASAVGRRDMGPNIALAEEIVQRHDAAAVQELLAGLTQRPQRIPSDCIKVLYEIGMRQPALLVPGIATFGALLTQRNNRLVWGAMMALDHVTSIAPAAVHALLPTIQKVAEHGSVITRDHAVGIVVKLCALPIYAAQCFPILLDYLRTSPSNQLPMYAEWALPLANSRTRTALLDVLTARVEQLPKASQQKRVHKVIRRLRHGA